MERQWSVNFPIVCRHHHQVVCLVFVGSLFPLYLCLAFVGNNFLSCFWKNKFGICPPKRFWKKNDVHVQWAFFLSLPSTRILIYYPFARISKSMKTEAYLKPYWIFFVIFHTSWQAKNVYFLLSAPYWSCLVSITPPLTLLRYWQCSFDSRMYKKRHKIRYNNKKNTRTHFELLRYFVASQKYKLYGNHLR